MEPKNLMKISKKQLLSYHSGSRVKNLSSEYGVSEVTIYKWIKTYIPVKGSDGESLIQKDC